MISTNQSTTKNTTICKVIVHVRVQKQIWSKLIGQAHIAIKALGLRPRGLNLDQAGIREFQRRIRRQLEQLHGRGIIVLRAC
jgi:hypothetical protein